MRLGTISTYAHTKQKINAKNANPLWWGLDLEDIEKGGRLLIRKTVEERKAIGDKVIFNAGDILYSKLRPYLLKILVASENGICTPEIVPFRMFGKINSEYIVNYLKSPYVDSLINSLTYGTKMPRVSKETMVTLLVPIPSLNEQKRIANRVAEFKPYVEKYQHLYENINLINDSIKEKLKKSILQYAIEGKLVKQNPDDEPASELIKRIRLEKEKLIKSGKLKKDKNESFIYRGSDNSYYEKFQNGKEVCIDDEIPFEIPDNWIWIRLESICTYIFSGKSPKYSKIVNNNLVLGQKNNQDYGIDLSGIKYCTNEFIENYPKEFYLRKNDVLLNTLGGGTVGRSGIFSLEDNKYITDGHLFVFRSINDIISHYLLYYLKLNREAMEKSADGSTNQTFLKLNSVKKYLIPCPPFQEQARIVSTVRKLFNLL